MARREEVRQSQRGGAAHVWLLGVAPLQLGAVRHFSSLLCSPNVPRNIMGLGLGTWSAIPNMLNKKRGMLQFARVLRVQHHAEGGGGMVNVISGKKCGSKLPLTLLAVGTSFSSQEWGQSFRH